MNELREEIRQLADTELDRANSKFPPFSSAHEGYAVLLEEIEEIEFDVFLLKKHVDDLWQKIKKNDESDFAGAISRIKQAAERVAAESVQAAAMCGKFQKLLIQNKKEGENA